MIEKMTAYSFVLLSSDKERFLEDIRNLNVLDITRSVKPVDTRSEELVSQIDSRRALIDCLRKGSDSHLLELISQKDALEKEASQLEVWGDYDRERLSQLGLGIHFYLCPAKKFQPEWQEDFAIQTVLEEDGKIWFVIVGNNEGFPLKELPAPERTASEIQSLADAKASEVQAYKAGLENRRGDIPQLEEEIRTLSSDLNLYLAGITAENAAEDSLTVFKGFAPTSLDGHLAQEFDKMDCVWSAAPATVEDNPPVKLRNNWFARQFEVLTGMYGMPVYNEFDPTPILAPFFLLFFSMCMGDAGYGILLFIISFFLKKMDGGLGKFWRLVRFLGIGTFFIGIFLGTFFGISLFEQSWVPQWLKNCMLVEGNVGKIAGFDPQIVLAIAIGIFHICLAMVVKTACVTKQSGILNNLGTWGWTLLIVGGIIVAAFAIGGLLGGNALRWTLIALGGISALGILFFNKPGRNPLLNFGAGLWDTYNMITGLLGDTLSYVRLYALGLAGGMLGGTFNRLAQMLLGEAPTWQWLPFILIILFGHALNLAMSCLGAFVHPLRLTFVEYFKNSGYEGKGTKYNPLMK